MENYGSVNSQPVKFGLNMIDYSKITDASSIVTALVPYGKEIDGKKLTIATVNNDCDYIYDEVAVAEYGWITDFASGRISIRHQHYSTRKIILSCNQTRNVCRINRYGFKQNQP